MRICLVGVLLAFSHLLLGAEPTGQEKVLHVAADNWMPYNGAPGDAKPGYVIELLKKIYEPQGVRLDYKLMSYAEALVAVREGRLDATIGPDQVEGKGMVLPKEAICEPNICLITKAKSSWTYSNISSLRSQMLGVVKGYSYWEALDTYIQKEPTKVLLAEGDEPLSELLSKLDSGEVQVVIETEAVLLWHIRSHKLDRNDFRAVYKQPSNPCFVGFAPNEKGRLFASQFDEGMKALRASGDFPKLLKGYGLSDWK